MGTWKRASQQLFILVISGLILFIPYPGVAQQRVAQRTPSAETAKSENPFDFEKYPGLLPALGEFAQKLQRELHFPPLRSQSRLLPLLPSSTNFYLALPNYGEVTHQTLDLFRQELKQNTALRNWWTNGEFADKAPKLEESLENFYQLSQYLGDEIVVSGDFGDKDPKLLIVSEIRKPGLNEVLLKMTQQLDRKSQRSVQILRPEQLSSISFAQPPGLLVLLRPDIVVAATDLATLRSFNTELERTSQEFISTSFGQRIQETYAGGVSTLGAADLQKLITQLPTSKESTRQILQLTGFDDVKYAVWNHTEITGQALSQAELSFNGPRHGIASWLGAPSRMSSLNFVSPDALMAFSVALKDPSQIFEEIQGMALASSPNMLASLAQSERSLGISFKDDLFNQLAGEITVEFDSVAPPAPVWKAIVKVKDPARFKQTLNTLFTSARLYVDKSAGEGITYQVVRIPSPTRQTAIALGFLDDFLIIASSPATLEESVRLHRTGGSLGKSSKFLSALPLGATEMSALWYQDPIAMATLQLQRLSPAMAASLLQARGQGKPIVACLYGEETAIRQASTNQGFDVGTTLVVAAIAIPNLIRARTAANEAAAVGTLRTINSAQVAYSATYQRQGFARDLASLGPDPRGTNAYSATHAGLIDSSLSSPDCAGTGSCEKSGYRFSMASVCKQGCKEYVVVATPVSPSTGTKNFCSTSDGVIRFSLGAPLTTPITASQCRRWAPLQ
jgi:type II secretory pathway pseudopilin PulG